ncbi:MAG: hypothetical protein K2W95_07635 [Candidatus Obscuribacterales bacterium]|nr:hypothetical protein [Candidatus Obscuribacterales bacterium]
MLESFTAIAPESLKTKDYVYQYKVAMDVELTPMVTFNDALFGHIPGLTEPVRLKCIAQRVCEKPEGLVR